MMDYSNGVDNGAKITLQWMINAIVEHNYTIDDVKSIIQARLDEMNNGEAHQYAVDARADHNSEEQFNHE